MDYEQLQAGHAYTLELWDAFYRTLVTGVAQPAPPIANRVDRDFASFRPFPWVTFWELMFLQLLLNGGLRLLVVRPVAKWLMLYNARRPEKVTADKLNKFTQSVLEAFFYSAYFLMGLRVVTPQEWTWPSVLWWTHQPDNRLVANDVTFFYIAYCARYFQSFIMVFLEPKRKDFLEMQIHHVVTFSLIYLSYSYGYVRVGCVIMVLFDIADPPLHMAKQFVYLKEVRGKQTGLLTWEKLGDLCFAIFALTFTVTRMVLYPYVVWSCTWEYYSVRVDTNKVSFYEYLDIAGIDTISCVILVVILQVLQAFWFMLLLRAVYNIFSGKELKDNRSDSEHSDFEDNDKKDK